TVTNVFGSSKAYRLDVRPSPANRVQSWLTVFEARADSVSALAGTGGAEGCVIAGPGRPKAAVFASSDQPALSARITFSLPRGGVATVVTDLRPGARYRLSRTPSAGRVLVALEQAGAGALRADSSGTLSFTS
ncbi:MAG TPA: hypothetical protein VIX82_08310, partial [Solirubrobacteraceae bacterium]